MSKLGIGGHERGEREGLSSLSFLGSADRSLKRWLSFNARASAKHELSLRQSDLGETFRPSRLTLAV